MIRTAFFAVLALVALASNAEARQRHKQATLHPECNVTMPCIAPYASTRDQVLTARGKYIARDLGFGGPVVRRTPRVRPTPKARPSPGAARTVGAAIAGIVAPLAAKVAEIQAACGSKVVSGVRHTYIAGTRRISLHASGKAVDMAGNPSCIYALLHGWAGGYSTDYARMRHIHLSYDPEGGREMGLRFAHGGHRHARRHARHHHRRYAGAR